MTAAPTNAAHDGELRSWRRMWPLDSSIFGSGMAARGRVRLRTLINLRWLAIGGQAAALYVVHFGLDYHLPLIGCVVAIVSSAVLNTIFAIRFPATHRLTNRDATVFLAFDVVQLAALLYLTGGIENPFSLMFLAPVVIAAATLNLGNTLILAGLALASISFIALVHYPLPWTKGQHLDLPPLYLGGIWASLVIGIGFISIYAWRIASEGARMQAGLAAIQLALAREHRIASLGALATAAAHELGTPLGTIAVVARELERSLPAQSPEAEDARLLRAEAERCRSILTQLARPEESVLGKPERLPLGALLDEIASEHRGGDIAIDVHLPQSAHGPEPKVWRIPELLHGLGNLVANAADFAETKVGISAEWSMREISLFVEDDGPGFDPEILERIGDPYVTSRPGTYALGNTELGPTDSFAGQHGMGLGFFIAKTLVEQTGGGVKAKNREEGGARVALRWPRGAIDGENPPGQVKPF